MKDIEAGVRASFITQAEACEALGSAFTRRLCRLFAARLSADSTIGRHIFNWEGDYSAKADNVALRLCGAINHLALTGTDTLLQSVYPPRPNFEFLNDDTVWDIINGAFERHYGAIIRFMKSAPQTNEVRRSAALIPAYHAIARCFDMPINLFELGASAGLNLYPDLYGIQTDEFSINPGSRLVLSPEWRGDNPVIGELSISRRKACDLTPVDISNDANCIRMLAYIWPDQIKRVTRTKAAIDLAQNNPDHLVEQSDAIEWLEKCLNDRGKNHVSVFHHTIAWQYFPTALQAKGEALFKTHGSKATSAAPLIRLSMESDGKGAGEGALLTMTVWPSGKTYQLGRADFHGRWVDWQNPAL